MSDYKNGWEVSPLPAGAVLRIGDERYTITDAEPREGGSSIFYRARREGSSLPYGIKECCPLELRDRLRRVNGLLVGTDEHAEKLLADARERLQTEAKISQEIAAQSSRTIPVLEIPGELRIEAAASLTAAPAGSFLLMRHMGSTGLTLTDLLSEYSLPPQEGYPLRTGGRPSLHTAALIIEQTLKALDLVHRAGYIYGDLQPGNLFFCDSRPATGDIGFAALLDFGCARALTDGRQTAPITDRLVFTTPGYAAPELLFANDGTLRLTPAADVYSAGRLLLYLLRGRTYVEKSWDGTLHDRLFDGERSLIRILHCEAENLGCDDETLRLLQELLDKSLAGEPENRWPDAAAMLEAAEKLVRRTAPPPNRLALSFSALAKGEFLGREEQLAKIDEALREHRSPVVIWGFAGMGKTELAIEFARRYHRGQAYFVRFQASVLETVTGPIADAFSGYSRRDLHGREKPEEQICREVLTLLAQRSENDLLIIDDIEDLTAHRGETAFRELCALPMQLMITTRTETDGGVEADTLPRPLLHKLLHRFDRKNAPLSEELADRLIDAAEGHTLTVELIGRTLKYSIPRISPESLLQKLKVGDLDSDAFAKVSTAKDREGKRERIQGHLVTLFQLSSLSKAEKTLFKSSLLMPADGMDLDLYCTCMPGKKENFQETLEGLTRRGFVRISDDELVTIHPLLRAIGWKAVSPGTSQEQYVIINHGVFARSAAEAWWNPAPGCSNNYYVQLLKWLAGLRRRMEVHLSEELAAYLNRIDKDREMGGLSITYDIGIMRVIEANCLEYFYGTSDPAVLGWESAVFYLRELGLKAGSPEQQLLGECLVKLASLKMSGYYWSVNRHKSLEIWGLLKEAEKIFLQGDSWHRLAIKYYKACILLQYRNPKLHMEKYRKYALSCGESLLNLFPCEVGFMHVFILPLPVDIRLFLADGYCRLEMYDAAEEAAQQALKEAEKEAAEEAAGRLWERKACEMLAEINRNREDWESMLHWGEKAAALAEGIYKDYRGAILHFSFQDRVRSLELCVEAFEHLNLPDEVSAYSRRVAELCQTELMRRYELKESWRESLFD